MGKSRAISKGSLQWHRVEILFWVVNSSEKNRLVTTRRFDQYAPSKTKLCPWYHCKHSLLILRQREICKRTKLQVLQRAIMKLFMESYIVSNPSIHQSMLKSLLFHGFIQANIIPQTFPLDSAARVFSHASKTENMSPFPGGKCSPVCRATKDKLRGGGGGWGGGGVEDKLRAGVTDQRRRIANSFLKKIK